MRRSTFLKRMAFAALASAFIDIPELEVEESEGEVVTWEWDELTRAPVYHNPGSRHRGVTYPVGTSRFPVNNLRDAIKIADEYNINEIVTVWDE